MIQKLMRYMIKIVLRRNSVSAFLKLCRTGEGIAVK